MKKSKFWSISSLLCTTLLFAASCTNDSIVNPDITNPSRVPVKFGSTMYTGSVLNKAYDNVWEKGDKIGVFMLKHQTEEIVDEAINYDYLVTDNVFLDTSLFEKGEKGAILYPETDMKVSFTGYYPFTSATDNSFPIYIDNENKLYISLQKQNPDIYPDEQPEFWINRDVMFGKADNFKDGYDQTFKSYVELKFAHKLCKFIVYITEGEGFEYDEFQDYVNGIKVNSRNLIMDFEMNLLTGKVSPNTGASRNKNNFFRPVKNENGNVTHFEMIVGPQKVTTSDVETNESMSPEGDNFAITLGDGETSSDKPSLDWDYRWNNPIENLYLVEGKKYIFNFTLSRIDEEFSFNASIKDWEEEVVVTEPGTELNW